MTTQHLREELERIASAAPVVEVPDDTWARARRSLARTRVLTGAAAVAVLAVVVGTVAWPAMDPDPPVAATSTAGLPDHLYRVPHGVEVDDDLAVGQVAAAWVDPDRTPAVLVGAADGAYHLVELDGLHEVPMPLTDDPAMALSPDGRRLAWGYGDTAARESGVRVADLVTGQVDTVPVTGGAGVSLLELAFSPDGEWLAWTGARMKRWDAAGASADTMAVGRLRVGTEDPETLASGGWADPASVGVDDAGTVFLLDSQRLLTFAADDVARDRVGAGRVAGPLVLDAASGALASGVGGDGPTSRPPAGTGAMVVPAGPGSPVDLPSGSAEAYSTALAWVGDDVLAVVSPLEGSAIAPEGSDLVLLGAGHDPRVVGHADPGVPTRLSIAADLVTVDRPTVDRPEPAWSGSTERTVVVGGLLALGLLVLLGGAWVVVRRRGHRDWLDAGAAPPR